MDSSCYKCGAAVEDSTPFCPNCNAPLIRVSVAGPGAELTPPLEPVSVEPQPTGEVQPSAAPLYSSSPDNPQHDPPPSKDINWSQVVPVALIAGTISAISWAMPFLGFLFWMSATGVLAVILYLRRMPGASLTSGAGARIGILAGAFGFGFFAILVAMQMLLTRNTNRFRAFMQQIVEQAAAQNADPRAQEMLQRMTSPQGLALILTATLVMALLAFLFFSGLGGALGSYLLRKRQR